MTAAATAAQPPASNRKHRLALLIDGENIPPATAPEINRLAASLGTITHAVVYGMKD